MAQNYPWPSPTFPNSSSPKSSKRPNLPSIASSSIYLTPVQEQRINSWRKHTARSSPVSPSPVPAPTPALTRSDSATTATGSPLSASLLAAGPPPIHPSVSKAKVRSAPASLAAPAAGSQCQACGGSCGCSTTSRATHPTGRNTMSQVSKAEGAGPSMPRNFAPFTPLTTINTDTGSGSGTGSGSKVRSYYSTKKYRQARAAQMREQSGFGAGGADLSSASNSRSGTGPPQGYGSREGGGGQYSQGGMNEPMNQYPPGMQPEWGPTEPELIPEREFSYVQAQPPVAPPIPRIAGARDPITQQYWRGMYPPVGGIKGTNPGMPMPMIGMGVGMGMGMFHPPMAGMPGMMPFH